MLELLFLFTDKILCSVYEEMPDNPTNHLMPNAIGQLTPTLTISESTRGDTDQPTCSVLTYDSLLSDDISSSGKRVMIFADAGVGKTTLSTKIAKDWGQRTVLQNISHLILVPMHKLRGKESTSLEDILSVYTATKPHADKIASQLAQGDAERICFIFDGLEKSPSSYILSIIEKHKFPKALVYMTCRPNVARRVQRYATSSIKIQALTPEEVQSSIKTYYDSEPEKAAKLLQYLRSFPFLMTLCSVHLNLVVLLFLVDSNGGAARLPDTETELIELLLLNVLRLSLSR